MAERYSIPGNVAILGSGETAPTAGRIYERLADRHAKPLSVAVLETPAGFELNSPLVAGRVANYLANRLQNYSPEIQLIPARKRGTPFSPDNDEVIRPAFQAELIFMGPGSPTYAVRQLKDSKLWELVKARHQLGASLAFASAATLALSKYCLPVYEIYKAGEDLHWREGLDFFSRWGMNLVIIPHWNNSDGGKELDTRRCFMGDDRFKCLVDMLPEPCTIIGIDEHTGMIIDFSTRCLSVVGRGKIHTYELTGAGSYASGGIVPFSDVAPFNGIAALDAGFGIEPQLWRQALDAAVATDKPVGVGPVPPDIIELVNQREAARKARDWKRSDALRRRLLGMGWEVNDTPAGAEVFRRRG